MAALGAPATAERIDPPALQQSGMPYLTRDDKGVVYLSWIDYLNEGHALRYSRWSGKAWGRPETIATGKNWFVNWADFPAIAALPDGSLWAHWLARSSAGGTYGYGIKVTRRDPQGTWREVHGINLDDKQDYAGFLSFAPETPAAFYLSPPGKSDHSSGHGQADSDHSKTARYIEFLPSGAIASEVEVDADVCSCCQTALARTEKGLIAAYRDHQPGEIRDISVIRRAGGAWTSPKTLSPDGWKINGCPTEGPSIASHGAELAIAWLTRAGDRPRIQLSRSTDSGEHFTAPVRIDDGNPLGRPSLAPFRGGSYLAVWLEKKDDQSVDIRLRKIARDGRVDRSVTVASASGGRASGLPKIVFTKDQLIVAWRDQRVRVEVWPARLFAQ